MSSIIAKLGLDSSGFKQGLLSAKKNVKEFASGLGDGLGITGMLGAAGAAAAMVGLGKSAVDMAGDISDASEALDMSTESLQRYEYAFKTCGVSSEDFRRSMSKLNDNIDGALGGNEKLRDSFARVGISMSDLASMSAEDVLNKIADASANSADPAKTMAVTLDLLGKSGAKMIPVLKQGAQGMREMGAEAKVMSDETIAALDSFGDRFDGLINDLKVGVGEGIGLFNKAVDFAGAFSVGGMDAVRQLAAEDKRMAEEKKKAKEEARKAAKEARIIEDDAKKVEEDGIKKAEEARKIDMEIADANKKAAFDKLKTYDKLAVLEKEYQDLQKENLGQIDSIKARQNQKRMEEIQREAGAIRKKAIEERAQEILAGPDARRQKRREERRLETARKRAEREQELKERDGMAQQDWDRAVRMGQKKNMEAIAKKDPKDAFKDALGNTEELLTDIKRSIGKWGVNK